MGEARERDDELWQRIAAHRIGPDGASLSFVDRLGRENRWSRHYAERVIGEYRRFCYLAVTAGHEVTPSDQVDQAWHLHLTYSRDYWGAFCPHVLGKPLHHGPTAGGRVEGERYHEQYARTLKSYEAAFGPPPPDIWSPAAKRFGRDPFHQRLHPREVIFLKDWRVYALAVLAAAALLAIGFALGRAA